jgi:hypothetical protein
MVVVYIVVNRVKEVWQNVNCEKAYEKTQEKA